MKPPKEKILIADDERYIRTTLSQALHSWGYETGQAASLDETRRFFQIEEPDAVLLDINFPDGSGLEVLKEIKESNPEAIVIMLTGNANVGNAVAALRGGAHDFIAKPVKLEELRVTIQNALEVKSLRREVKTARHERLQQFNFNQIIGDSEPMRKAKELARRVAESDVATLLLLGESGTGKDLFAKAIHYGSPRHAAPFLAINCAALPGNLIESELFGYEKGAFTDAKAKKEGLLEQAQGGTIFLDEIGEMDVLLQAKLLRVLEESFFRRVGGLKDLPLDVRVIAASNRDLKTESEAGHFRLDLYYRLSVIQIEIPPLRERGDDILRLAEYYIEKTNQKRLANKLRGLAPETEKIFKRYSWRGNVRELRNVIERASILEDGDFITTEYLPADLTGYPASQIKGGDSGRFVLPPEGITFEEVEHDLALQAVARSNGNLTKAARLLGISRDGLRYRLKKSGEYNPKFNEDGS